MADYVPRPDNEFGYWHSNYYSKLLALSVKYGITTAQLTQMQQDNTIWDFTLRQYEAVDTFNKQFTSFKKNLRNAEIGVTPAAFPTPPVITNIPTTVANGIERRARSLARIIKAHPSYTEADGKALGIIGEDPADAFAFDDLQPIIRAVLVGGKVQLKWKKGKTNGINIYVKRGDADFVFLAFDGSPDYVDNTPLPAEATTWVYRAIYVVKDTEVGQFSDPASINVRKIV